MRTQTRQCILIKVITLTLLLSTFSGFAKDMEENIDRHTERICAESNLVLNLQEIKGILDSSGLSGEDSNERTCSVWESFYYPSIKSSPFSPLDDYSGPVLYVKMIADGGKGVPDFDSGEIILREEMVCVKQDGERLFMAYNLESSNYKGFLDGMMKVTFSSSEVEGHFRKSLFQFDGGKLVWAGQVIENIKVTSDGPDSSYKFFQCGNTILN